MFSPTKLDNGAWGARIRTPMQETVQLANGRVGQEVTIETKAGKTFTKRLTRVVERRTYCTIYATAASVQEPSRYAAVSRVGHPVRTGNLSDCVGHPVAEDPEAELARREGADMTGEPDEANLDTIKASEVGWMITTVSSALSCAAGEYDLPADDIERVKAMLGRLIADGIEHGRVIA